MIRSNLSILLEKRGLKQKDLANMTKIRPNTISDIVNEEIKQYPANVLEKICEALDCNIEDILYYEADEKKQ